MELIHHPVSNLQSMGSLQNRPKKVMLQQQHRGPSHLLALGDKRNFTTSETGALSYDGGIHHWWSIHSSHQLEKEWSICHTKQTKMKMQTKQWKWFSNQFSVWVGFFRISWGTSKMAINNSSQLFGEVVKEPAPLFPDRKSIQLLLVKEGTKWVTAYKIATRWFKPWPLKNPRVVGRLNSHWFRVTFSLTIPKRSPAELPSK